MTTEHVCEFQKDNQGFCWTCGKPVDRYWYACYINPLRATELCNSTDFNQEWQALITRWENNHES